MYILGINYLHADSSVCLLKNDKIIFAAEEERFSRIKHDGRFPKEALIQCLKYSKINFSELNYIVINTNPISNFWYKFIYCVKKLPKNLIINSLLKKRNKMKLINEIKNFNKKKNLTAKIIYVDHHLSHLSSSYFLSPFDEAVVVSIDGFGDFSSIVTGYVKKNKIFVKRRTLFPHSLGIFYQAFTQFLGFENYGDEYKIMGLSSYGKPKYLKELKEVIYWDEKKKSVLLNLKYFNHEKKPTFKILDDGNIKLEKLYDNKLTLLFGKNRNKNDDIFDKHKDLAKSVQVMFENLYFKVLNQAYDDYPNKNLILSGGCTMNSVANGKIIENTNFKNIFVQSSPGDGGGSIGASLFHYYSNLNNDFSGKSNFSPYLGTEYADEEIKNLLKEDERLKKFKIIEFKTYDELVINIVEKLINKYVIGWFQGRMEWGPRALGNRSILADPRHSNMISIINHKIKRREGFRPFAPSILVEEAENWFKNSQNSFYMEKVLNVRDDKKDLIPAVTHIDGTGRLQTVSKEINLKFYKLIESFYKKTNIPILLNTSFNENEPIVENPKQAIDCFVRTSMDLVVLNNFMISRS